MFGANLRAASRSIQANRLRALLTTLGVIIGVAAVVTVSILLLGVNANVSRQFASLGTNMLSINGSAVSVGGVSTGLGAAPSLTSADVNAVSQVAHVTDVTPVVQLSAQTIYGDQNWNSPVWGVYPNYLDIQSWQVGEGSWFSQADEASGSLVAVLGQTVAQNLFGPSGTDPLGQTVRIDKQLFRVVGVLTSVSASTDDSIYMPLTTLQQRFVNESSFSVLFAKVDTVANLPQVEQDITTQLRRNHHLLANEQNDFLIRSAAQLVQASQQVTQLLASLLIGLAAISLTVGGIGIMNIMLVSVSERTREIGVRMAMGARRSDIRNQFLMEAVTICALGGVMGILLGLLCGYGLDSVASANPSVVGGIPYVISPVSIAIAFGVAVFVGVVFGFYPAARASRLDPIVALRTE